MCAAVAVLVAVVVTACDVTVTGVGTGVAHNCNIRYSGAWTSSMTLYVDDPAECPMTVQGSGVYTAYAADATFPSSSGAQLYSYTYSVTTWKGTTASMSVSSTWYVSGDTYLDISGNYYAATAGFDSQDYGVDTIHNNVMFANGWGTSAAPVVYHYGYPGTDVEAPDSVGAGLSFNAHAAISDWNAVPPVSYAWTVNGSPISATGADVSITGPISGSMTVGVTTTDGNSVVHGNQKTVSVCSNNQITC